MSKIVKMLMYIRDYVKERIPTKLNGKTVFIERPIEDPNPELIISTLMTKLGSTRYGEKQLTPESWKKIWLQSVNDAEGKHYNTNMSLSEFILVLEKEGVIQFEEVVKEEKSIELTPFDAVDGVITKTKSLVPPPKSPRKIRRNGQITLF